MLHWLWWELAALAPDDSLVYEERGFPSPYMSLGTTNTWKHLGCAFRMSGIVELKLRWVLVQYSHGQIFKSNVYLKTQIGTEWDLQQCIAAYIWLEADGSLPPKCLLL